MLHLLKKYMGYFAASLTLLSPLAYAGVIVHDSTVWYGGGNSIDGGSCCGIYSAGIQNVSRDGSAVSARVADTLEYSGLNGLGESDTMTVNYDAQSYITDQGEFKAGVSISVDNPFHNSLNPPYVLDDNFDEQSVDPDGLPSFLYAGSGIFYRNDLTIQSDSDVSSIKIDFSIDGWINENNAEVQTYMDVSSVGSRDEVFQHNPPGSVNDIYIDESPSIFIDVIDDEARLEFEWLIFLDIELDTLLDNVGGTVDFLNTMKFGDFTAFDADINVIDDAMIVGSAGKVFSANAVTAVPTPGSIALTGLGLLFMATTRKHLT